MKTKVLLVNLPCYLTMKSFVENDLNIIRHWGFWR